MIFVRPQVVKYKLYRICSHIILFHRCALFILKSETVLVAMLLHHEEKPAAHMNYNVSPRSVHVPVKHVCRNKRVYRRKVLCVVDDAAGHTLNVDTRILY